ncbi:IS110 family transposase [Salicibibacter cibarius]|uniref:IS110 family transposase n=1 Tax=Salicibibacter cibarius TaxID=2743000 RepID=A0A7T7CAZ2_9BACI|nr:transposase [Salicibibacter cibarius]QQK75407.1 IS110 family transposase [Salicibibacter cibarius]
MLFQNQKHQSELEAQIDVLVKSFKDYALIQTIPGVGKKTAATILSEIGDVHQFQYPNKLVAYTGIDPSAKRSTTRLRQALYTAVQCGLTKNRNLKMQAFYDRKREEGKPHKVAVIACANKLLHCIYAIIKQQKAFLNEN